MELCKHVGELFFYLIYIYKRIFKIVTVIFLKNTKKNKHLNKVKILKKCFLFSKKFPKRRRKTGSQRTFLGPKDQNEIYQQLFGYHKNSNVITRGGWLGLGDNATSFCSTDIHTSRRKILI